MNKKDKLEDFILNNREVFDQERPSFKVWADIEANLHQQRNVKSMVWKVSIAASVVLIIGMTLGLLIYPKVIGYQEMQAYTEAKDLNGAEHYFATQVNDLMIKLHGDAADLSSLSQELSRIDQQVAELKAQLADAPIKSKEKIYEAIIASFETKIELLETAVNREKEINNIKNEIQEI